MKDLQQQISYLQGLAEGMNLEKTSEGKVITGMWEVLSDMADYISCLQEEQDDLADYVENLDSDLADLEDDVYLEQDEEDHMIEVNCPNCGEEVLFDDDIVYDEDLIEVVCPSCGAVVFVNDDEDDEDEDDDICTCGCSSEALEDKEDKDK